MQHNHPVQEARQPIVTNVGSLIQHLITTSLKMPYLVTSMERFTHLPHEALLFGPRDDRWRYPLLAINSTNAIMNF